MNKQQPEALYLAYELELGTFVPNVLQNEAALCQCTAAELRRQHARITELESQLAQRFDAADMATAAAQGFRDGAAAPQPAVAAGWQSIETAPKDGSYLLLWEQYSEAPFVGYWSCGSWSVSHEHVDAEGGWDGANVVDALSMPITHWMPLPPPPTSAEGVEHG